MANEHSTVDELSDVVKKLRLEQDKLEKEVATIEKHIRAVETTISLLKKNAVPEAPAIQGDISSELQGKTLIEALIHISSKSGGILKVANARQLMQEAGLLKNPKNALSVLYTIMNRSGKFEKVNRGEYRFISQSGSLLNIGELKE